MPSMFQDHPRKRVVREQWDTPALEWLYGRWGRKYFYFGLPGPKAYDIRLWRRMIRHVVAFELEAKRGENPRRNIEELRRNLTILNIAHTVYCGPMEEVVLWREDHDKREFELNEFVTLFNLDFCNPITGRIETADEGRRCLRFETIREIITIQRRLFRRTRMNKFVILITAFDSFHVREMERFVSKPDLSREMRQFVNGIVSEESLPSTGLMHDTRLLKAFVFDFLRDCLHGQNAKSFFLPVVSYAGRTERSPMIHFVIVCVMEDEETAQVVDQQCALDFLRMRTVCVLDEEIGFSEDDYRADVLVDNPVVFLRQFESAYL